MSESPWLTKKTLVIVHLLLKSYQKTFNESLLTSPQNFNSELEEGKALFTMPQPVMAHDNTNDPCLNYANASALQLWSRCWKEMIGMPSRLTAPETEQAQRNNALKQADKNHAIKNYQGIRIDSKGKLFMIKNARIWTIWDEQGSIFGQAATFNLWEKI